MSNENCDMVIHARGAVGVDSGSTLDAPTLPSRDDFHDSMPSDDDISSFIDEHAEWNCCFSESLDPHDVAFDDFDGI